MFQMFLLPVLVALKHMLILSENPRRVKKDTATCYHNTLSAPPKPKWRI